ncbi:DUF7169 domain-containing protein [Microcella alkalica]|uniref:DUF7169 domain-containing protein n=1 Tax=Microcella alkalica TaxID=355930 RepID=UPI003D7D79D0
MAGLTDPRVRALATAQLRVRQVLIDVDATEAEWRLGRTPVLKEDTTERSKGLVSDPTPHIVMDTRRRHVHDAAVKARRAMAHADRTLHVATKRLEAALARLDSEASEATDG